MKNNQLGKNFYRHGSQCKDTIYYCIEEGCDEVVSKGGNRCRSHAMKKKAKDNPGMTKGENSGSYIDGRSSKQHYCIIHGCNNPVSGIGRMCQSCYGKSKRKSKITYYCIEPNCNRVVSGPNRRCIFCSSKEIFNRPEIKEKLRKRMIGSNNPNWKKDRTKSVYYCIESKCNSSVSHKSNRCRTCADKSRKKPKKIHYCIELNCNKVVKGSDRRCSSCAKKGKRNPTFNRNFFGSNNSFYGKKHTRESKKKQSLSHGGTGIPGELFGYGTEFDGILKEQIRKRDDYTCQMSECNKTQKETGRKLDVHHIDYNKKNNDSKSLISLCRKCHMKTNYNRTYWYAHFRIFMFQKPWRKMGHEMWATFGRYMDNFQATKRSQRYALIAARHPHEK